MSKKRTLNEYRQSKEFGYKEPETVTTVDDYYKEVNFEPKYVVDLIKENPNDTDLGEAIRKYYLQLKKIS